METQTIEMRRDPGKRYSSPRRCIYCGSTGSNLTDEHIIPYSLTGNSIIFEKASCRPCADYINKEFEEHVTRQMLLPFRVRVDSPTRNPKRRPAELPITFRLLDDTGSPIGDRIIVEVPSPLIPLSLMSWRLPPPGLHLGIPPSEDIKGEPWTRYSEPEFRACERAFREASGYDGNLAMKLGDMDPPKFLRFLAKTAHAFAVAELGCDAFEPYLLDLIFDRSRNYCHFIGGEWEIPEPF